MTTKQPPAQKHLERVERAKELMKPWVLSLDAILSFADMDALNERVALALDEAYERGKTEALASKVVSEPELEIRKSLLRRIEYLEAQLAPKEQVTSECKLQGHKGGWDKDGNAYCTTCDGSAPNEPVISPDINKKEISNDMDNCVCDETHIHNCPVHTHLQDEPEVKAQGFEWDEYAERAYHKAYFENLDYQHSPRNFAEAMYLAGQASQVRLPEKKDVCTSEADAMAYQWCEGYNAAIDDMRKLNGLENV